MHIWTCSLNMLSDWEEKEKSLFEEGNKMLSDKI